MKRVVLFILMHMVMMGSFAQKSMRQAASNYLKTGSLDKALEVINQCIQDPSTATDVKTWFIRGSIYYDIANSTDEKYRSLDPNSIQKALDSYKKAQFYDIKKEYFIDIQCRIKFCEQKIKMSGKFQTETLSYDLLEQRKSDENWIKDSLSYLKKTIEGSPSNIKAHWGMASLYEYSGMYDKAVTEYKWVVDNSTDLKQQAKARVHMITCRYMATNNKKQAPDKLGVKIQNTSENDSKSEPHFVLVEGQKVDVSPQSISERSGWTYLKGLATSIAVTGSVSGLGGDAKYVEYALNLLTTWIEAPTGQGVQTRNEFIAGMISTFASIISKYDLTLKLNPIYNPITSGLPSEGYAGNMQAQFEQEKFEQANMEEKRQIVVSDDLTITEKTVAPNISGEYDCIYPEESTTGIHTYPHQMATTTMTISPMIITQRGNELRLTLSTETASPPFTKGSGTFSVQSSGNKSKTESIGIGSLSNGQAEITFTNVTNTSGSTMYIGNQATNIPGGETSTTSTCTIRILTSENNQIELGSSLNGKDYISRFRKR